MLKVENIVIICFILIPYMQPEVSVCQVTTEVNKVVPLEPGGEVSLHTYKGRVLISTWDSSQVDIHAQIEPDDGTTEAALNYTEVNIRASRDFVYIKTDYSKIEKRRGNFFDRIFKSEPPLPFVNYNIKIPQTARMTIDDYKSEIAAQNLMAELSIDTYKGSVKISGSRGYIRLNTYKGFGQIQYSKLEGRCNLSTYKGVIELLFPKGSSFDLDCDLGKSAEIRSEFDLKTMGNDGGFEREYRVSVNGGGIPIYIRSDKGEIHLLQR